MVMIVTAEWTSRLAEVHIFIYKLYDGSDEFNPVSAPLSQGHPDQVGGLYPQPGRFPLNCPF